MTAISNRRQLDNKIRESTKAWSIKFDKNVWKWNCSKYILTVTPSGYKAINNVYLQ
jgi:hypothetical protein